MVSLFAAYAFTRIKFKGSNFWFSCVMITMMIPSQVMVVPQYIVLKKLNLIDTRIALILPWFFGAAFFIFMLVQFFRGVPKELDEAAEIDGCGRIAILFRILAPVVKPSIITASIFAFYWIWQDFFQPLIFMSTTSKFTLSLALNMFLDPSTYNNYGGLFAMSVLSLLPTIIFFIIFQRYLVDGGNNITIKFTWWGNQSRHDYTQKILDKYTELHPNVKFEAIPAGWDGYFDKLSTQAASGSMPDIVQMDYLYLTTYANNNSIADLQPYVDDGTIDVSQIADNVVDAGKVDKKLAGIVGGTGTVAIGYNPEVFKEAGIEEPNQDGSAWTWDEFVETAKTIKKKTGKYGICSGVADDTNIFNYWVRSHGEQLFSDDNKSLGYDDDQILVDYLDMWKDLMDCDAEPDPDEYTQIQSLGQEAGPVVTGDAAMLNENNNYASKMSSANPNLKVTIPPVSDINKKAIWNKPSYMLCISEKSKVKKEAAEFINWFINSEESNDIMMAERGVPSPQNIRDHLLDSGKLNEKQQEMFEYADQVVEYTGDTPDPDPMGISEVSKSLQDCAYSAFYGNITTKEAAEKFRKEANEILERNN